MASGPKGVAGTPDSLPAQQTAADPLQNYCPDLDQWPGSWAYEERDIPYGLRMVECFKPFLCELLALPLSRKTLRQHRDNIWVLGGEVIRHLQMDSALRRQPIEQAVLNLMHEWPPQRLVIAVHHRYRSRAYARCRKTLAASGQRVKCATSMPTMHNGD
jgi:hypothetical protein